MIFLPNKYERFCAAVRNRIQNQGNSLPLAIKTIEILQKIYYAEAVLKEGEIVPIDLKKFAQNLLGAVQVLEVEREESFKFKSIIEGQYLLDKKCLEILLDLLAKNSSDICIYEYKTKIVIKANTIPDFKIKRLLQKIDANSFYENKSGCLYAVFTATKTLKQGINVRNEEEIISNPFSSVNIFI